MKRFFVVPVFLILLLFSGCSAKTEVSPPFFKVEDEVSGGTVYLLGTMHVGLPDTVYPEGVYNALDSSDTFVCEVDLNALEDKNNPELSDAMKLLECNNETAADFIGEDYTEVKEFFQKLGIYNKNLDKYIPSMWSSVLSNKLASDCGYASKYGTDRVLQNYAEKKGIKVEPLETAAEQYKINADESRELQVYTLISSAETDYQLQKDQMCQLYAAWSTADSQTLENMLISNEVPESLTDDYSEFFSAMYEQRQKKMADRAISALQNGDCIFIAVGALHFYASPDVLDFLTDAGYSPCTLTA